MINAVYVTGNANKAKYFSKMIGLEIEHQKVDVEEIQELNLQKIVEHKAKEAFRILRRPVLVEDTSLRFEELGSLPGPFIKWFIEEIGIDGLAKLVSRFATKKATAGAKIAYFDGKNLQIFESELDGTISSEPRGTHGFGWNQIFIPNGKMKTLGEMDDEEFVEVYKQIKPFDKVREYLLSR